MPAAGNVRGVRIIMFHGKFNAAMVNLFYMVDLGADKLFIIEFLFLLVYHYVN